MKTITLIIVSLLFLNPLAHAQDYLGKYERAYPFKEGRAAVMSQKKWGFINEAGEETIPPKYENSYDYSEGLAAVMLNGKYGYIDKDGKTILPLKYEGVGNFQNGASPARLNEKWGIINKTGKELTPFKYDNLYALLEKGLYKATIGKKQGIINQTGKVLVPVEYDAINGPSENTVMVKKEGKWALLDLIGKELTPFQYSYVGYTTQEKLWMVQANGKYGYINAQGKVVIPIEYFPMGHRFSDGLVYAAKDKLYGFLDRSGKTVVPIQYTSVSEFSEGLAAVQFKMGNNSWGYINPQGHVVIPAKYNSAQGFSKHGLAIVTIYQNGLIKYGVIDRTGKEIVPPNYDDARIVGNNLIALNTGKNSSIYDYLGGGSTGKWGIMDNKGKWLVKQEGADIGFFSNGYASINVGGKYEGYLIKGGKWGLVDSTGTVILPAVADVQMYVDELGFAYVKQNDTERRYDVLSHVYVEKGLKSAQNSNYQEAMQWFKKGVDRGNSTALGNMGFLYMQGMGVQKDVVQGLKLVTKGAERGDAGSMMNLAKHYVGQRNKPEAVKWLRQAETAGHPQAKAALVQIASMNFDNVPNQQPNTPATQDNKRREKQ